MIERRKCACCGDNLKAFTHTRYARDFETVLRSKADCERVTNSKVVSVSYETKSEISYNEDGETVWKKKRVQPPVVGAFSTWDGKSIDAVYDRFCTNSCAQLFAIRAFNAGYRLTSG